MKIFRSKQLVWLSPGRKSMHWKGLMGYNGIIGLIIRETELASDCVNTWMNLTEGKPNLCGKFIEKQAQMKKMNISNNSYL